MIKFIKMSTKPIEHWQMMGEHFGYPQCCIDYFCAHDRKDDNYDQKKIGDLGYGYTSCPVSFSFQ